MKCDGTNSPPSAWMGPNVQSGKTRWDQTSSLAWDKMTMGPIVWLLVLVLFNKQIGLETRIKLLSISFLYNIISNAIIFVSAFYFNSLHVLFVHSTSSTLRSYVLSCSSNTYSTCLAISQYNWLTRQKLSPMKWLPKIVKQLNNVISNFALLSSAV